MTKGKNDRRISLMDTTLRDGEQTQGVSFSANEKVNIARALLQSLKVDRIEVASACVSDGEQQAVAKICAESNVKKFIHVSAIGANENSKSLYQKSKFLGEQKALENFKKTVIIRPSVVCGPEDNFTNLFSKLSILPVIPVVGKNYKFQPILVSDVASSILKAIETKNNESKIYEIGGPKIISFGDMIKSILSTIFE